MTVLAFHNAVLDSDLPMGVKMALITIDRHRNKEGDAVWPSIERLCHLSSSKKTAFMGYLKVAEGLGWLTRERRFNRSNVFDLCIPAIPQRLADTQTPIVQNLNHQTVDGAESERPMVRNVNFEVTKEVTNNLEVTNVIFAREESAESAPATVVTDSMRRTVESRRLPFFVLTEFEGWYAGVAHLWPDPEKAFARYVNAEGAKAQRRMMAH